AKASYKAKEFLHWASELEREACPISELWVSTKCGESDTTTGLAYCPTVGNMYDKLIPKGITGVFGETSEITGAEHIAKSRAINAKIGAKWMRVFQAYQDEVIEAHKVDNLMDSQPTKGNIAGGLTTIEEKALGNPEKIGPHLPLHRGAGAGRDTWCRPRALLHGHLLRGRRVRDADGGSRLCRAHLPDRPGQRHRQSDRSRH